MTPYTAVNEVRTTHTPGPWEESGSRNIIRTKTYANERGGLSGGVIVAQFWTTPSEADARLIAAAPDMLKALHDIRDAGLGGYLTPDLCADIVTRAIASAESSS